MGGPGASLSPRGCGEASPVWGYGAGDGLRALAWLLRAGPSNLVPLLCCATVGTSVPPGKGPLSGLNGSVGSSGAGSPLLRPVPLLPFSNTSCGFLT